ncbi:serine/threonine-protein kinase [Kolteria novifilia]
MANLLKPNAQLIPGYRLIRHIGRGGFGEVWEAEAPGGLSKAIKVAPVESSREPLNVRELDGLRKVRALRHPFLLSIERFEVIDDAFLVIVMELADKSLDERFAECRKQNKRGIPRDELLRYLVEAAEVLDVMNKEHGLQHLDVKPGNLLLSSGHVKVADFGLVQPGNTQMSVSGMAISPPYAPPELFDGQVEDTADQYSLAVMYQELLTGERPFEAPDVRQLIYLHLTGKPNLAPLPASDRSIVARAIQRDPSHRYPSCRAFARALLEATGLGTSMMMTPAPYDVDDPVAPVEPAKAHFVRHREERAESNGQKDTIRIPRALPKAPTETLSGVSVTEERVKATFLAFLPLEIYAHKLRGFMDALGAELINCQSERTVLRLRGQSKRWFHLRSKGLLLEITTSNISPHSGVRVVETIVRGGGLPGEELTRRGMLLIRCLKSFLMASDDPKQRLQKSNEQLREEILG